MKQIDYRVFNQVSFLVVLFNNIYLDFEENRLAINEELHSIYSSERNINKHTKTFDTLSEAIKYAELMLDTDNNFKYAQISIQVYTDSYDGLVYDKEIWDAHVKEEEEKWQM